MATNNTTDKTQQSKKNSNYAREAKKLKRQRGRQLIASLLGMNVINGMENVWWGFPLALAVSGGVTVLFMWYFKRKAWI